MLRFALLGFLGMVVSVFSCLAKSNAENQIADVCNRLSENFRAVALEVDAASAPDGMIQPHTSVDILWIVVRKKASASDEMATTTLLQNLEVLSVGQVRSTQSETQPTEKRSLVVAATPRQATRLVLAQRQGTLSVILRGKYSANHTTQWRGTSDWVCTSDLLQTLVPDPQPLSEISFQEKPRLQKKKRNLPETELANMLEKAPSSRVSYLEKNQPTLAPPKPITSRHAPKNRFLEIQIKAESAAKAEK